MHYLAIIHTARRHTQPLYLAYENTICQHTLQVRTPHMSQCTLRYERHVNQREKGRGAFWHQLYTGKLKRGTHVFYTLQSLLCYVKNEFKNLPTKIQGRKRKQWYDQNLLDQCPANVTAWRVGSYGYELTTYFVSIDLAIENHIQNRSFRCTMQSYTRIFCIRIDNYSLEAALRLRVNLQKTFPLAIHLITTQSRIIGG